MKTILLILGAETGEFAGGKYNRGLFEAAKDCLSSSFNVVTTIVEDGYEVQQEIVKWKQADFIIYQYPVYWFMMPSILKKYMDEVYAYGEFFAFTDGAYGSGGLMKGKSFMLSTTWNAPTEAFGTDFFDGGDRDAVLLPMRKSQSYCGLDELAHFSSHDVIKNPDFDGDKARFIEHLRNVFQVGS
ncbi:NAD(P)H-dependent oxidoreductase [Candidatus Uabimicrobium amorphum]|uniref:NAD(P)H dehydrogenase (Quinone) n=1 Tax=Uabimicrobium amorphum TaxID=2596890 RepID=A0A5S9IMF6_UABAM|nr:NAD(P)H-dependent oxidoreductase [Candidatus Uabimicrobium amorphum]BBM84404.1 NAD(P)H dehydrogenase (quinone) [Candidatus Uabimicrobium amorphum]